MERPRSITLAINVVRGTSERTRCKSTVRECTNSSEVEKGSEKWKKKNRALLLQLRASVSVACMHVNACDRRCYHAAWAPRELYAALSKQIF